MENGPFTCGAQGFKNTKHLAASGSKEEVSAQFRPISVLITEEVDGLSGVQVLHQLKAGSVCTDRRQAMFTTAVPAVASSG